MKSYPRLDDPMLNLVFSIYHNPGVYALLIGSGVSRTARIPTGWEVTLDLIRKTAKLHDVEPEDPEKWYIESFGKEPDYSELLEFLAKTQHERKALLNAYFEPSQEEIDSGIKVPTKAHIAIASLVNQGYIRVILTTNFDRLLEQALEKEGVIPDVIYNEDTLKGIVPLIHSKCMIIKLHGDYKDTRIKNTSQELAHYSKKMNELLDRILDEFGLIVCGWSGQWDTALRGAILRCQNRRYTTYWTIKGELTDEAIGLIQHRKAVKIEIDDADKFFTELFEKVTSLACLEQPHPISTEIAVESVKKFMSEDRYKIQLHDFVTAEIENTFVILSSDKFNAQIGNISKDIFQIRLHQYEMAVKKLINIFLAIGYYDINQQYSELFKHAIERIGTEIWTSGHHFLLNLQFYPALLLLYATGIIAVYKERFRILAEIISGEYYQLEQKRKLLERLTVTGVFYQCPNQYIPREEATEKLTPETNYIFDLLYEEIKKYIPDNKKYDEFYNIFEFLLGMIYMDLINEQWSPNGRFIWKWREQGLLEPISISIIEDYIARNTKKGDNSPIFKAGLFSGSHQRLNEIFKKYVDFVKLIRVY